MNKQFFKSRARALAEVIQLNESEGYYRWKTISMSNTGYWFADECLPSTMTENFTFGFFVAHVGVDYPLHEKFEDTQSMIGKILSQKSRIHLPKRI